MKFEIVWIRNAKDIFKYICKRSTHTLSAKHSTQVSYTVYFA